jgi:SRSO17 transposase
LLTIYFFRTLLVQEPSEAEAMRQRLQECIAVSDWNEDEVWSRLALHVEAKMPNPEAFVLDDTGFPKKGEHSVGVARQYSGTLGRVDNCQVATSLHLAGEAGSACIGMRLYLPEGWAKDAARREKAGVSEEVEFHPKWQLGLELLDKGLAWGSTRGWCWRMPITAIAWNFVKNCRSGHCLRAPLQIHRPLD